MMWRLNLLAFVCCMALDNQYMLYYIWYVSSPSLHCRRSRQEAWRADLNLPLTTPVTSTS